MFELADQSFEVTRATLVPFVSEDDEHVVWGAEVDARGAGELADWEPNFTADRLVTTRMGSIRHWQEIAPASGRWTTPSRTPEASLYVFEHGAIYDCAWALRREGARVCLRLDGRVDVASGAGPLESAVAIRIDLALEIAPWSFGRVTERECRATYARTGIADEVDFRDVRGVAQFVFRPAR